MARTERQTTTRPPRGVTAEQLREAERTLRIGLASTFSPAWISRNVGELLAEAIAEYVEWLETHSPAPNPTAWLVQCARWRAPNLVDREVRRSGPPLESVIHTVSDPASTPDEIVLEQDRVRRIQEALSHIEEKDRRLLILVYFEGHSIREAGRLLGWEKSSADRHHAEANERLKALIGERDLIAPALFALTAEATMGRDRGRILGRIWGQARSGAEAVEELVLRLVGAVRRGGIEASRRAATLTEFGTATGSGGLGRAAAQCGALIAICGALVVSAPPVETVIHGHGSADRVPATHRSRKTRGTAKTFAPDTSARVAESSESSAVARNSETRRIEHRRTRRRRRERTRRKRRARNARKKARARASQIKEKRNENLESAARSAPQAVEPAVEPEAVPEGEAAPPPATGRQAREEFGL